MGIEVTDLQQFLFLLLLYECLMHTASQAIKLLYFHLWQQHELPQYLQCTPVTSSSFMSLEFPGLLTACMPCFAEFWQRQQ